MTRLEVKAIMAAIVSRGVPGSAQEDANRREIARQATLLAEEILQTVERRSTEDDNEPLRAD